MFLFQAEELGRQTAITQVGITRPYDIIFICQEKHLLTSLRQ